MREQPHAQSAQDALGDGGREVVVQKRHHLDGGGRGQVQEGKEQQPIRPPNGQMGVDDGADDERRHQLDGGRGQHRHGHERDPDAPRPQQAEKASQEEPGLVLDGARGEPEAAHLSAPFPAVISATRWAR